MVQGASCFTVAATTLERPGTTPLLAVERYQGDKLVEASIMDPTQMEPAEMAQTLFGEA